jgi:type III restriction enzyme
MTETFFEQPILNSPYAEPTRHHALDEKGQPTQDNPIQGRRKSDLATPMVPGRRRRRPGDAQAHQTAMDLGIDEGDDNGAQHYDPTPIINEIRSRVAEWRRLPSKNDWGVTPATARLLEHWRHHDFEGIRPFFCQIEAVETIIWLTEVARRLPAAKQLSDFIINANLLAEHGEVPSPRPKPILKRQAMKMATGAGKTTVMAMLIAWNTVNHVRSTRSKLFSRGFLIVTPGITIRDRLRVLMPNDPESYYMTRELVPPDMLEDVNKAKIVITNYHAFQPRKVLETNRVGRSLLQGRGDDIQDEETEGQIVRRVAEELMGLKNIIVINDEAHHCYREKPNNVLELKGDEKKEAEAENKAARLWINGLEVFKRKLGVQTVYDLSATPFFLGGSGWREGALFPWTVSDFSLIDAIECGIVKLPRVPVADNSLIPGDEMPIYRNLWEHIGKDMPKKGRSKGGADADPRDIPDMLKTAFFALYKHYAETFNEWKKVGIDVPPVFIVVCNNTSTSKLVHEWISGWERPDDDGELKFEHNGHLELFRNYDENGNALNRPNTLLIDSQQIESGAGLDDNFKRIAAKEIELFKREKRERGDHSDVADSELLREVMNTVGKKDRLGERVRCVVSVSMLTEGWDTNTVTHILGIRAFGTQLLCEQVVGRALRRYSYLPLDETMPPIEWMFGVEYADIMGIPFDFTARPQIAPPKPPKKTLRVAAVKERSQLEIQFPNVSGYRVDLPEEWLPVLFSDNSTYVLTPKEVGPGQVLLEGVVGESLLISAGEAQNLRPSTIAYNLAKYVMLEYFKDEDGEPKLHLFGQIKKIVRRWIDENYFKCTGDTGRWMAVSYPNVQKRAGEKIYQAIVNGMNDVDMAEDKPRVKAILNPYNQQGLTRHIGFQTTKEVFQTNRTKCHVNYVVIDSGWEEQFALAAEHHPNVLRYVKNQGLGLEVPYRDGSQARKYIPDFIVVVDDGLGSDNPLHVIVEVKGYRDENVKLKSETMKTQWVPGVNNLGQFGRWEFIEYGDVWEMSDQFNDLIDKAIKKNKQVEAA